MRTVRQIPPATPSGFDFLFRTRPRALWQQTPSEPVLILQVIHWLYPSFSRCNQISMGFEGAPAWCTLFLGVFHEDDALMTVISTWLNTIVLWPVMISNDSSWSYHDGHNISQYDTDSTRIALQKMNIAHHWPPQFPGTIELIWQSRGAFQKHLWTLKSKSP